MSVSAEKLDSTVLKLLHMYPHGKGAGSLTEWCAWIEKKIGDHPDETATVAALKRLRNRGLVRLAKYTALYDGWYDYRSDQHVDERWFFYIDSFWIILTEQGRALC